jgi:Fe-Mn family superoxide dismutase
MKFILPKLPYETDALAPVISERQLDLHYREHLRGYVDKLNKVPSVVAADRVKLEEVILEGRHHHVDNRAGVLPPGERASTLYNLSAQIYNHTFFFKSMKPKGGGKPGGKIGEMINEQFGDWGSFRKKLIAKGQNLFGSGWIWVTIDDEDQISIIKGFNAETPFVYKGLAPLLCIDVWEHAYYLDYQNRRGDYIKAVVDRLLDWDFADKNLENS